MEIELGRIHPGFQRFFGFTDGTGEDRIPVLFQSIQFRAGGIMFGLQTIDRVRIVLFLLFEEHFRTLKLLFAFFPQLDFTEGFLIGGDPCLNFRRQGGMIGPVDLQRLFEFICEFLFKDCGFAH